MKDRFGVNEPGHHPAGAAVAGAAATVFHDAIMTPMDVIKQRLQLGYHKGMMDCVMTVRRTEGVQVCVYAFASGLARDDFELVLSVALLCLRPASCAGGHGPREVNVTANRFRICYTTRWGAQRLFHGRPLRIGRDSMNFAHALNHNSLVGAMHMAPK